MEWRKAETKDLKMENSLFLLVLKFLQEDVHGEAVSRALQFARIQDGLTFLSSLPHKITN